MKTLQYTPTQFDACESDVSTRILQYAPNAVFTVTHGEGSVATVEFQDDIDTQTMMLTDAAMISLGYFRQ